MLLLPGPVEVPDAVLKASAYVQNHRSQEFRGIVQEISELLNRFAGSSQALVTTGSGTSAVESVIYSMVSPGEKVLAVTGGEFGNRMASSLRRRGAEPTLLAKKHTEILSTDEIEDFAQKNPGISTLFVVHNETGNGTALHNLKHIAETAKGLGMKVLVDSVSGFAGTEIRADSWGIDAFASCSQKGLASVPGAGIVCLSEEGVKHVLDTNDMPSYLDLNISLKFMSKQETPYTPSTGTFRALLAALKILEREKPENRWKRHHDVSSFVREQLSKHDLPLYGNNGNYSDTVVAFRPPVPSPEIIRKLAERGISVAKGTKEEAEIMIRVGLLGLVDNRMAATFLNELYGILGIDDYVDSGKMPASTKIDPEIFNL